MREKKEVVAIATRLADSELAAIDGAADRLGIPRSTFLRAAALEKARLVLIGQPTPPAVRDG